MENSSGAQYALTLKAERPIAGCELTPNAFLCIKGGAMDNLQRQKMMEAKPHFYEWTWSRSPKKKACANTHCPRGDTFEPTLWSRASLGGCALQCAVCYRNGGRSGTDTTFCSEICFYAGWQEHNSFQHLSMNLTVGKQRPRDADSLGGDECDVLHQRTSSADNLGVENQEYVTICKESAYTPTHEDIGCDLRIVVSALSVSDRSRIAGPIFITTLPVLSFPHCQSKNPMLQNQQAAMSVSANNFRFRVVSYNILAQLYATRQAYPYCDTWSLVWPYRKKLILKELEEVQGDVICLQEVQMDHFEVHLNPFLTELGYDGLFKQKSRESMGQYGKVDGCAIFWKRNKFVLNEQFSIEFNDIARRAAVELGLDDSEARRYMNKLSKDNIAMVVVLEVIIPGKTNRNNSSMSRICIANTHLYSNVQRPDVKLWQSLSLLHELEQFVIQRDLTLLLCGDFNSEPHSAVYELLSEGMLTKEHPELVQSAGDRSSMNILPNLSEIYHNLDLTSAVKSVMGSEPVFTNFTSLFKGTLDYIFYNPQRLCVTAAASLPSASEIQYSCGEGLPSACFPSDHLMLCCDVAMTMTGSVTRQQHQHMHHSGR